MTLTCLMPGPTETPIFHRPQNRPDDAPIAESDSKDNPADVARAGYEAMMRGERGVVHGFTSNVVMLLAGVVPQSALARIHRAGAEPRWKES